MILLPAILSTQRSLKDRTISLTFSTNEITPDQFSEIGMSINTFGYLAFKTEPFTDVEKWSIQQLKTDFEDTGKTPGQRLRAVLYKNFEKDAEGYKLFPDYYNSKMETLINHFKQKLD